MSEKKFVPSEYQLVVDATFKDGSKKRQHVDLLVDAEEKERRRKESLAIPPDLKRGSAEAVKYGLRNSIISDRELLVKEPGNDVLKTSLKFREMEQSLLDSATVQKAVNKLFKTRGEKYDLTKITARDMVGILEQEFNKELREMVMKGSKMDDEVSVGGVRGKIGELFEAIKKLTGTLENEEKVSKMM